MFSAMDDGKESKTSSSSSSLQGSQPCRHFEYHEILLATHDFDESFVIGHGGFGKVYRGDVNINGSGLVVAAIKRLDSMSNQGATEFWAEVEMLSKLRHSNLVSLIGYCNHEKEKILVYEYMPNGTLEDHLHKYGTPLSWLQQLNICLGAARGLHYIHTGAGIKVIHRDVKTSNILLDENWTAKISDFGLSKMSPANQPSTYINTAVRGTFGYLDPDYYTTGKLTKKSDVYAFGVVMLEVLCRKRAVDTTLDEEQWVNLAIWAQQSIKAGNLKHIVDSFLRVQISPKCLKEFVRIIKRCLHNNSKERSTMAEVVVSLESVLSLQEKYNNLLHAQGRTIFGRMADMIPFTSNGENSGQGDSKPSSSTKGNMSTNGRNTNMLLDTREVPSDYKIPGLKEFKFVDLKRATYNFNKDLLLRKGSFGWEMLGWIDENTFPPSTPSVGIAVAVKRYLPGYAHGGLEEWQVEVHMLGKLAHPNIISLLGYCNDKKDEFLLVYEYMQNQSLHSHLYPSADVAAEPLSWGTRLRIMMGVARGLSYLHISNVIHRDVKSTTILLDQVFNAKLGDFAVARSGPGIGETHVSTECMGTFGYIDPKYVMTGQITVKTDIYSFGVVLLETLTGLKALDINRPREQINLVEWLSPILGDKEELKKIIDPRLEKNYPEEGVLEYAKLALRCLADEPKDRPSSEEVLQGFKIINSKTTISNSISSSSIVMLSAIDDGESETSSSSSSLQAAWSCRHFEFHEILHATHDFDESLVIGHGGFGKVYRGDVNNGSSHAVAAIKRLDSMSNQGATEFWAEVEMLSKLRHCNLVSLFGAARGLHYIHTGAGIKVIHRDVKSSNILLDKSWAAKISDFGLSKLSPANQPSTYVNTAVRGTFGYLDPDYYTTGKLTKKSDVYAFGVVMLEVLCRKRAVDTTLDEEQWVNLAIWAQQSIKEGNLKHIIDYDIRGQISPKCLKEFVRIIKGCLHNNSKQRFTMAEVVVSLESVVSLQEKHNKLLQTGGKTIFSRMVDVIPFSSKREKSGQGDTKPSSSTKGNMSTNGGNIDYKIPSLKEFKFVDLVRATNNFNEDRLLGRGGFGPVMLGWIDENTFAPSTPSDGIAVAVKRLHLKSSQGQREWQVEVDMLGKLAHPNIISLLGYCNDKKDEYLLVYEYMQNQSLDSHLYPTDGVGEPLSWGTRLRILIGAAYGLSYLHSSNVIHGDVKSTNILLDQCRDGTTLIDPRLEKNYPEEGAFEYAKLALRCLEHEPKDRPSTKEVLQGLKQIY
ncbi:hypothetical protein OSB04_015145, partial [Centaurea solstitialis]